jgi:methyl-accepting chemotaxis protein
MISKEIEKAIGAHGIWKHRLKSAIEDGKLDTSVKTIAMDNQCDFGKWLDGPTLTLTDKTLEHFKRVKELHEEFHKIAARVAGFAVSGNKAEAEKLMAVGGEYSIISAKLTAAMMEWKKSVE